MVDLRELLDSLGLQLRDFGKHYRSRAEYRNSTNNTSLSIDKETGSWYDFGLSKGGNLQELLKLLNCEVNIDDIDVKTSNYYEDNLDAPKFFEKGLIRNLITDNTYWIGRGVSNETVRLFNGGIDLEWKLKNRYVFPVYDSQNRVIGLFGRDLTNNPKLSKYKILGSKKNFKWPLFLNHEIILNSQEAILVESPACVLRLWDCGIKNVICLFGTDCSPLIVNLLVKYNIKRIIIATNNEPDNDNIGNRAACGIAAKLLKFFDSKTVLVHLPSQKDFAEMNDTEIKKWQEEKNKIFGIDFEVKESNLSEQLQEEASDHLEMQRF